MRSATRVRAVPASIRSSSVMRPNGTWQKLGWSRPISTQDAASFERVVAARRSAKSFDKDRGVDDALLLRLAELTRRTPSGFNLQPYKVALVRSPAVRRELAYAMLDSNIRRVLAAPVTAVFLADLRPGNLVDRAASLERDGGASERQVEALRFGASFCVQEGGAAVEARSVLSAALSHLTQAPTVNSTEGWAFKNTMLAVQSYLLAATSLGLDTSPMEGFDNRRVLEALGIDPAESRYAVPCVVATGYSADHVDPAAPQSARFPLREVFFVDGLETALE